VIIIRKTNSVCSAADLFQHNEPKSSPGFDKFRLPMSPMSSEGQCSFHMPSKCDDPTKCDLIASAVLVLLVTVVQNTNFWSHHLNNCSLYCKVLEVIVAAAIFIE